jgi:hypothetical protein
MLEEPHAPLVIDYRSGPMVAIFLVGDQWDTGFGFVLRIFSEYKSFTSLDCQ